MSRLPDVATPHPDEILEMKKDEGSDGFDWMSEKPGSFRGRPEEVQKVLDWLDERGVSRRDVWNYAVNIVGPEFPMQYADWFLKEMPVQQFVEWSFNETNAQRIIENLDRYEGLDHDALFDWILETGKGKLIAESLEKLHVKDLDAAIVRMGEKGLFERLVEREDADEIFGLNRLAKIAIDHGGEAQFLAAYKKKHFGESLEDPIVVHFSNWYADNATRTKNRSWTLTEAQMGVRAMVVGAVVGRIRGEQERESDGNVPKKARLEDALTFYSNLPPEVSIGTADHLDRALIKEIQTFAKEDAEKTGRSEREVERELFDKHPDLELVGRLRLPEVKEFMRSEEGRVLIRRVQDLGNRKAVLEQIRKWQFWDEQENIAPESRQILLDVTLQAAPERFLYNYNLDSYDKIHVGNQVHMLPDRDREAFVDKWIETDALGAGMSYLGQKSTPSAFELTDAQRDRMLIAALEQNSAQELFIDREKSQHHFVQEFVSDKNRRRIYAWLLENRASEVGTYGKDILEYELDELYEQTVNTAFQQSFLTGMNIVSKILLKQVRVHKEGTIQDIGFKGRHPDIDKAAIEGGVLNDLHRGDLVKVEEGLNRLTALRKDYLGKMPSLDHPWIVVFEKLRKVQAHASREDLDPWKKELEPLIKFAITGRMPSGDPASARWGRKYPKEEALLSTERAEDAEAVLEFVKEFGMMNMPRLFEAYTWLKRAKKKEDIPEIVAKRIASFIGERRYDKLGQPHVILNDLRRSRRSMTTRMLEDELPYGLGTEIGDEVFNAVRGSTKWEQKGDNPKLLADMWREFVRERPDRARVPEGYQEVELQVAQRREGGDSPEVAQKKEEVIKTDAIKDIVLKYDEIIRFGGSRASLIPELERGFDTLRKSYEVKLGRLTQRIEKVREPESVARIKTRQVELQGQMTEMKALQALLPPDMEYTGDIGNNFTLLMEELSHFKDDRTVLEMIGWLSYAHMSDIQDRWRIDEYKEDTEQSLRDMDAFLQSYVFEHYLHSEQDAMHTGHKAFSPELLEVLNQIWRRPEDGSEHPLRRAVQQLDEIGKGHLDSRKKTSIAMVPDQGLLRVVSGDTGNACYTSQHRQLATGEYPELHAYTFVTGRDTAQERFVGSVLFVEGEANDSTFGKGKTLIVRGNNPRENLIQSVDGEELIRQTLEEAIATAERRGIEYVAVPFDPASASSSNRPAVADTYRKWFANCPRIQLKETPETKFNGYDNWDPNGDYPLVVIWSKERGKIGNWPT